MRTALQLTATIPGKSRVAWAIARYELRTRFSGTALGGFWVVFLPIVQILTYWFVFAVGFRVHAIGDTPFVLYFLCGFSAWTFFSEAVGSSVNIVTSAPHLVKKVVFPVEVIVVTKVMVATVTHLIIVGLTLGALLLHDRSPGLASLWILLYWGGAALLATGLGWLAAALNVFFRDVGQFASVLLNLWFWFTPVVWAVDLIPRNLVPWMYLNPMVYVVNGYRTAILGTADTTPVWACAYFWGLAVGLFLLGATVFRNLKPDFAELL